MVYRQERADGDSWYERAAAGGFAMSMNNLAALYRDGAGVPVDYSKARQLFEKAAALGDGDANPASFRFVRMRR